MALKVFLVALPALLLGLAAGQEQPIRLTVDASDAAQRLIHARMTVSVRPGPFTLLYPEWIPGEHGPTGPIADLVGLQISGGGKPIEWLRDDVNMYAFHIQVPEGVTSLSVTYDFISPPESEGFSSGGSITSQLAVISWNQVLLYPAGIPVEQIKFQAALKVPAGWRYGTALPLAHESGNDIEFQPASLSTLIDSPVQCGRYYKTIDLSPAESPPHYLHLAADSQHALDITKEEEKGYRNLVRETSALFGAHHYRDYHFLLTLSDHVAHFGLEHHESSDDRVPENSLIEEGPRKLGSGLLPHEFVHSWNGKFRRPAGLATGGYDKPMKGELLWVYEGLTEYLGEILTPRSGLSTPGEFRDTLAMEAAALDQQAGRKWRPLEDTARAAQILYSAREDYSSYRRSVDYYEEGTLIWLEADVTIRKLSKGARSLDDFCRLFHGGESGPPRVKTYTRDDVIAALNEIQPFDWTGFFHSRVDQIDPNAPLGGIEGSGWKLIYEEEPSELWKATEAESKSVSLSYSIGIRLQEDGEITDVALGSAAYKAGLAPKQKVIAVNGRQYSSELLRRTIKDSPKTADPIELLIKDSDYYQTVRLQYHGGDRYPFLKRAEGTPDILSQIIAARATPKIESATAQ